MELQKLLWGVLLFYWNLALFRWYQPSMPLRAQGVLLGFYRSHVINLLDGQIEAERNIFFRSVYTIYYLVSQKRPFRRNGLALNDCLPYENFRNAIFRLLTNFYPG